MKQESEENSLLFQLFLAQQDAENISIHLNLAKDPVLIENLIYKHKAAQIRLGQLLRAARAPEAVKHDFSILCAKK